MKWLGLFAGLLLGLVFQRIEAIVSLGFLGFIAGLVADLVRGANRKSAVDERVAVLERKVAVLEAHVAGVRPGESPSPLGEGRGEGAEDVAPPQAGESPSPLGEGRGEGAELDAGLRRHDSAESDAGLHRHDNPVIAWLTGGNAIARVGLLILFFGLAFLLKYAVEHAILPPELRVGGVAIVGLVLLVGGWRLRERRPGYALGLQGGGVAVLYLVTFAAYRLYHLLPATGAFMLLAAIAVFSAILAIAEDALVLAAFGTGGGLLAPILASTGEGSHVALFGYYLLLNLGIALVALRKSWRSLNIMGFAFTFFIGLAWGWKFYKPEFLATTEPFLVAFFLLYLAIAVLHARPDAPDARRLVDGTIVFGVPLGAFGLQSALMREVELGMAFSCIATAALYLALTASLKRSKHERFHDLAECFLALGVVFATLAIPFALDERWTCAFWALEGAAIVWVSLRQGRRVGTAFGLALQLGAGAEFGLAYHAPGVPWLDSVFLGALIIAIAGLITSRRVSRPSAVKVPRLVAGIFFGWGIAWWLHAASHDVTRHVPVEARDAAFTALFAATSLVFSGVARRLDWREARWPALALLPILVLRFFFTIGRNGHLFETFGWAAWIFAFAALAEALRHNEDHTWPRYRSILHAGSALLLAAVGAIELHWTAVLETSPHSAWTVAAYAVAPCIVLLAIAWQKADTAWPVRGNEAAYRSGAGVALAVALVAWTFIANATHDGRSDPLPYMPVINALDLAHILVILAIASLALAWRRTGVAPPRELMKPAQVAASVAVFFWLNAVLLRSIHHYAAVPYAPGPLLESVIVQAALSIFWTVLALALMLYATRKARRAMWVLGAALLAVVVVKLFLIDLSHVTGVERIVSFIAVGLLMLAVGWFAPVPPRAPSEARA